MKKTSSSMLRAVFAPALALSTLAMPLAAQTTYNFNGASGAYRNWGTNGTWLPNTGTPGALDTVNLLTTGATGLTVNASNREALHMNATALTASFEIIGGNTTLTIHGTLTKSGDSTDLTFRNTSSATLAVDINAIDMSGASWLNFGQNSTTTIAGVTIGSLNLNTTSARGIAFYSNNGATMTIGSADITQGRIVIRNVSSGSATLDIGRLDGSGGLIMASNSQSGSTGNLRLSIASGTATYSGRLLDAPTDVSATLNVEKTGAGRQNLAGDSNTYTGTTTINGGTLAIVGNGQINSSAVTVNAGGTFIYSSTTARTGNITLNGNGSSRAMLGGTGAINTAVTLDDVGDTLAPGEGVGQQTFGVSQSWDAFTYQWDITNFTGTTAGADFDQIAITGGLTLNAAGSFVLDITSLSLTNFNEVDRTWVILSTTTGISGFDANNWTLLADGFISSTPEALGFFELTQNGNNLMLSYTAVPEPSTWGLLLATGLLLAVLRRRCATASRVSL